MSANAKLLEAAQGGDLEAVQAALAAGADLSTTTEAGSGALAVACVHGHLPVVKALIAAGADVDAENPIGQTPVWYALSDQFGGPHGAVLEFLVKAGADVNHPLRETGNGPLTAAVGHGRVKSVELLLEAGADPDAGAVAPLMLACATLGLNPPAHALALRLIAAGAHPQSVDERGRCTLCHAASAGDEVLVDALIAAGADPRRPDPGGLTPADLAERSGHATLAARLRTA